MLNCVFLGEVVLFDLDFLDSETVQQFLIQKIKKKKKRKAIQHSNRKTDFGSLSVKLLWTSACHLCLEETTLTHTHICSPKIPARHTTFSNITRHYSQLLLLHLKCTHSMCILQLFPITWSQMVPAGARNVNLFSQIRNF